MKARNALILTALILAAASLFAGHTAQPSTAARGAFMAVDFIVLALTLAETALDLARSPLMLGYVRKRWASLSCLAAYLALFIAAKWNLAFGGAPALGGEYANLAIVLRNIFLVPKMAIRMRRMGTIVESLTLRPAQSILVSFFLVILVGALVLMLPAATPDGRGLGVMDAWFTSVSAVCVTGLVTVDTASSFTAFGRTVILLLIQIGGLGIMLLTFFAVFSVRKSVSLKDKLLIAYMLSEEDMTQLSVTVRKIVGVTFAIEGAGAGLLTAGFLRHEPFSAGLLFSGIFHSVSAFCNAGFSLFPASLETYVSDPLVCLTVSSLIILGGLSFSVMLNLTGLASGRQRKLVFNSVIVLIATAALVSVGTLLFYGLEHGGILREYPTATQYLASFFQAVTLRTAGFNTVPLAGHRGGTALVMKVFMLIGGASGSTAGGIKVNTAGVVAAHFASLLRGRDSTVVFRHGIHKDQIIRAFTVLCFGLAAVTAGGIILSLTEEGPLAAILFETVSAFATVGLTMGITPSLSVIGKVVVMLLMFAGRLGPLTILTAAAGSERKVRIEYPQGDILLG